MPLPEGVRPAALAALRPAQGLSRGASAPWGGLSAASGLLAAMAVLAAVLVGCRTSAATATGRPLAGPTPTRAPLPALTEPVRIIFWHAQGDEATAELLQRMADRFGREHPYITVQPVYVGNYDELYRKSVAAVQAGNPPDLVAAPIAYIGELARAKAIAPLDPYLGDPRVGLTARDRSDLYPGYREAHLFRDLGGQTFSFPFSKSAAAMFYNLTALKAGNLEGPPDTWEAFDKACRAATRGNVRGLLWQESAVTFTAFLYSRGAELLVDDQNRPILSSPEAIEALELLRRLTQAGHAFRPEGARPDASAFTGGRAALAFGSTRDIPAHAEAIRQAKPAFEWGATILPHVDPSRPRTVRTGASLAVLSTSEARQQAAWLFIRWFTNTEQAAEWTSATGYLPVRRSAVDLLAASGWLAKNPVYAQVLAAIAPNAYPEPGPWTEPEVRRLIEEAWSAIVLGDKPPQQALDEAAAKANEALAPKR